MLCHLVHNGAEARNGAAAQIIAIGKPAGQQYHIAALQVVVLVPKAYGRLAGDGFHGLGHVLIAVGTGESDDAEFHVWELGIG
jgi:hypothetical protein